MLAGTCTDTPAPRQSTIATSSPVETTSTSARWPPSTTPAEPEAIPPDTRTLPPSAMAPTAEPSASPGSSLARACCEPTAAITALAITVGTNGPGATFLPISSATTTSSGRPKPDPPCSSGKASPSQPSAPSSCQKEGSSSLLASRRAREAALAPFLARKSETVWANARCSSVMAIDIGNSVLWCWAGYICTIRENTSGRRPADSRSKQRLLREASGQPAVTAEDPAGVEPAGACGRLGEQVHQHPGVEAGPAVEPDRVIDAGDRADFSDSWNACQAGEHVGDIGQRACVHDLATELLLRSHPAPARPLLAANRLVRDPDFDSVHPAAAGQPGRILWRGDLRHGVRLVVRAVLGDVEGRRHIKDDHPVLHGYHAAVRVGTPVPVPVDHQQYPARRVATAEEVAVQRVRAPVVLHGFGRGPQRLGRHLAAVQAERVVVDDR